MLENIDKIIEQICRSTSSGSQHSGFSAANDNNNNSSDMLPEETIYQLCQLAQDLLIQEPNIAHIDTPVTICGDIHGQLHDLLNLFTLNDTSIVGNEAINNSGDSNYKNGINGDGNDNENNNNNSNRSKAKQIPDVPNFHESIRNTRYIFLGDFVDRGFYSLETFLLLICLKIRYPDRIILVRGNHETRQITKVYGFYDEILRKYGNCNVWRYCCEVFDYIPLGCLINNGEIFCLHGGLSPNIQSLNEIKYLDRKQEVPHMGLMCDLLWSDPDENVDSWSLSPRGAGYLFGQNEVEKFTHLNGLSLIARAHQLVMEGYKEMFDKKLVTVWSAPNYCYRCGNVASVLQIDDNLNRSFKLFEAVPIKDNSGNAMIPNRKAGMDYFL